MHNRKEGALALLAVHGGGSFITGSAFIDSLRQLVMAPGAGTRAALWFSALTLSITLLGGFFAYVALRQSGDAANKKGSRFLLYEAGAVGALGVVVIALGFLIVMRPPAPPPPSPPTQLIAPTP